MDGVRSRAETDPGKRGELLRAVVVSGQVAVLVHFKQPTFTDAEGNAISFIEVTASPT